MAVLRVVAAVALAVLVIAKGDEVSRSESHQAHKLEDSIEQQQQQQQQPVAEGDRLEILAVAMPMSPLHSIAAISQELCLRGHNVTVASLGEDGIKKTRKYTPRCAVNYLSLGPAPLSGEEISAALGKTVESTNSTLKMLQTGASFAPKMVAAMHPAVKTALEEGRVKPDFGLLSVGTGQIAMILQQYGVEYAINIPTNLMPPVSGDSALWVPPAFMEVSIDSMGFLDRLMVLGINTALYFGRRVASHLKLFPPAAMDLDPATSKGRLVLVNSVPGLDYPQALPPLVQYTGPIIDVKKMEDLPTEVEAWLETVPEGKPVVYISYGTVFHVPADHLRHAISSLAGEDIYVLWALPKANQNPLPPTLPPNIFVHHWISTPRALSHPKVKAFVSHCGGNSVSESMAIGVPIIGYPVGGDQPGNCNRMARSGAGITHPSRSWMSKEDIMKVLSNPEYEKRALAVSRLFKLYGGVTRAATLVEAAARGDLGLMVPPTDVSFDAWVKLGGYDLAVLWLVGSLVWMFLAATCVSRCVGCCFGGLWAAPPACQPKPKQT